MEKIFNHNRTLDSLSEYVDRIRELGFNPIAVTQLYCEETFVFETASEAEEAYLSFGQEAFGWWYGKEEFKTAVENYERKTQTKVLIYWL